MNDLMIDIETMGNTHNSVMIQIAGVYFDRKTGETGEEFMRCFSIEECEDYGFETTESTKKWWNEQNQDILKLILENPHPLKNSMKDFSKFVKSDCVVWSHSTFDFPIVQNYLKKFKFKQMPYKGARDIRTLVDLSNIDLDNYDWSNKTHNAIDDCKFQIKYCVDAIKKLRNQN